MDFILEYHCSQYMAKPDDKWEMALTAMVESFLKELGGYKRAGLNVLRFCLITQNLLSTDHSLREENYMENSDAIMGAMEYLLGLYLESKPDLAIADPKTIKATVAAERKSIMILLARESFCDTVGRIGFSESDLKEVKVHYEEHAQWYDEHDKTTFMEYIKLLEEAKTPEELAKLAAVISLSLYEIYETERPTHRRLTEYSDYVVTHIEHIRRDTELDEKYEDMGYTRGMLGLRIAAKMIQTEDES